MKSKSLYKTVLWTLIADVVVGGHVMLLQGYMSPELLYKGFYIMQAIVWTALYYGIYYRIEDVEKTAMLTRDKYITRIACLFFILVPFSTKQIIDELTNNNSAIDLLDYPVLLIMIIAGAYKYYPEGKFVRFFNSATFNLIPNISSLWMKSGNKA